MELIPRREGLRRPSMRQVVVVMPSAFTLGNLFFGFWAIVSAFNGNFRWAGWFIVFAGILDMLDGRVARLSNTGTRFGAELDSLVDVISFGVAPALLIYFLDFASAGRFAWILCYIYVTAVALRLARFNVLSRRQAVHRLVHRHAVAVGRDDARGLLPLQPDRVVPGVARLPRPAAPGAGGADAAARAADGEQRQVPQVPADRAPEREGAVRPGACT